MSLSPTYSTLTSHVAGCLAVLNPFTTTTTGTADLGHTCYPGKCGLALTTLTPSNFLYVLEYAASTVRLMLCCYFFALLLKGLWNRLGVRPVSLKFIFFAVWRIVMILRAVLGKAGKV